MDEEVVTVCKAMGFQVQFVTEKNLNTVVISNKKHEIYGFQCPVKVDETFNTCSENLIHFFSVLVMAGRSRLVVAS